MPERRVVAIVLPELLCELVLAQNPFAGGRSVPFAVVWSAAGDGAPESRKASESLAAVSDAARRAGVHVGQRVAEARAQLAHLAVREIGEDEVRAELERVAEVALAFGTPVAIESPDTVWVDVTGGAHLWGGEDALLEEIALRVQGLSHRAQIAVASGPHLARAFAHWEQLSPLGTVRIPTQESAERIKRLPLQALSLDEDRLAWFARLGVLEVGQLVTLPTKSVATRLGPSASQVLALMQGHDPAPLTPYEPPRVLSEESSWEEPVSGLEPLLFVVRKLVGRLSARLEGRGEAAQALCVCFEFDRAIAQHRGVSPSRELRFDLAAPLWRENELERVVRSRLERTELGAPTRALRITIPELTVATARQLDLSGANGSRKGLEEMFVLLAELGADVGADHVGVLELVDSHRPEDQCALESALPKARKPRAVQRRDTAASRFTRLLPKPLVLSTPLCVGESIAVGSRLYSIDKLSFVQRLEAVEWWTTHPTSRDYLRLWLSVVEKKAVESRGGLERRGALERRNIESRANESGGAELGTDERSLLGKKSEARAGIEALVFVDRATGKRFLQAIAD